MNRSYIKPDTYSHSADPLGSHLTDTSITQLRDYAERGVPSASLARIYLVYVDIVEDILAGTWQRPAPPKIPKQGTAIQRLRQKNTKI